MNDTKIKDILISVIIPAYNSENTIKPCLMSVINQKRYDVEIIVIDDGSIDDTKKIVEKICYKYDFVKYFYQSNGGVSSARNNGIKKSQGNIILFLDSDDELSKDSLNEMMNFYEKYNSDCVAAEVVDNNGTSKVKDVFKKEGTFKANTIEEIGNKMFYTRMGSAVGKIFKKEIIEKYKIYFDEKIGLAEDFIFVHEYFTKCKSISKNGKAHYIVHNRPISLSKSFSSNIDDVVYIQRKVLNETFKVYPNYKQVFYQYEMNIVVSGMVNTIKNMYLYSSTYNHVDRRKKIKEILDSEDIKTISKLSDFDGPKCKTDKIYLFILKTESVFIIDYFFLLRENVRKLKTRINNMRKKNE